MGRSAFMAQLPLELGLWAPVCHSPHHSLLFLRHWSHTSHASYTLTCTVTCFFLPLLYHLPGSHWCLGLRPLICNIRYWIKLQLKKSQYDLSVRPRPLNSLMSYTVFCQFSSWSIFSCAQDWQSISPHNIYFYACLVLWNLYSCLLGLVKCLIYEALLLWLWFATSTCIFQNRTSFSGHGPFVFHSLARGRGTLGQLARGSRWLGAPHCC